MRRARPLKGLFMFIFGIYSPSLDVNIPRKKHWLYVLLGDRLYFKYNERPSQDDLINMRVFLRNVFGEDDGR